MASKATPSFLAAASARCSRSSPFKSTPNLRLPLLTEVERFEAHGIKVDIPVYFGDAVFLAGQDRPIASLEERSRASMPQIETHRIATESRCIASFKFACSVCNCRWK